MGCPAENSARASQPVTLDGGARSGVRRLELAGWALAVLAAALLRAASGGPALWNDSYQYLSVAENLASHRGVATSIVHFDTERVRGTLPAPETTFPPGYPALIAALSWTGVSPEWRGAFLSMLAAAVVVLLLGAAARALRLGPGATRFCLAAFTLSAEAGLYAIQVSSDMVFTAIALGGLTLLLQDERSARAWRPPLGNALLALACWIRYAGLFLVAAIHLHALVYALRAPARRARWIAGLVLCDAIVLALVVRNMAIAGTWKGGNTRAVHHGVAYVAYRLATAVAELGLGPLHAPLSRPVLVFAPLLAAGAVVTAVAAAIQARRHGFEAAAGGGQRALLAIVIVVYGAGLCYVGFTSHVSVDVRMLVPLLPALSLLLASALSGVRRVWRAPARAGVAGMALLGVGYAGANVSTSLEARHPAPHAVVAASLALPTASGEPLRDWIERNVPRDAVLLAMEGQATGYVLDRRTVSAVGRLFSDLTWSEAEARDVARDFGAGWVIVYPDLVRGGTIDKLDSPLFRRLAAEDPPDWLELAAGSERALVYRVRP
jgi:hypothetical protein